MYPLYIFISLFSLTMTQKLTEENIKPPCPMDSASYFSWLGLRIWNVYYPRFRKREFPKCSKLDKLARILENWKYEKNSKNFPKLLQEISDQDFLKVIEQWEKRGTIPKTEEDALQNETTLGQYLAGVLSMVGLFIINIIYQVYTRYKKSTHMPKRAFPKNCEINLDLSKFCKNENDAFEDDAIKKDIIDTNV
jgi:hypothetical protein